MDKQLEIDSLWQRYLDSLPPGTTEPRLPEVWSFGDTAEMGNELGALAKAGTKTATCSLVWEYEAEGNEDLPKVGDVSILTDGEGWPLCVVETTEVEVKAFNAVDEDFAFDEGEGNRTLAYWQAVHWEFFSARCATIDRVPSKDMPLLCERFRVLVS